MQEPKFSVGRDVAVWTRCMSVIIPATTVTHVEWEDATHIKHPLTGRSIYRAPGWAYRVADSVWRFGEECLRPINPETEYQETEQEQEA